MTEDHDKLETLLRIPPEPRVPVGLLEKLRADLHARPGETPAGARTERRAPEPSSTLSILIAWLPFSRWNLSGLAVAWIIIGFCRITTPDSPATGGVASLRTPSPGKWIVLTEQRRLSLATTGWLKPMPNEREKEPEKPRGHLQKPERAG